MENNTNTATVTATAHPSAPAFTTETLLHHTRIVFAPGTECKGTMRIAADHLGVTLSKLSGPDFERGCWCYYAANDQLGTDSPEVRAARARRHQLREELEQVTKQAEVYGPETAEALKAYEAACEAYHEAVARAAKRNFTWEEFRAIRETALANVFGRYETRTVQGETEFDDYHETFAVDLESGFYYALEPHHMAAAIDELVGLLGGRSVDGERYGRSELTELVEEVFPHVF